MRPPEPAFPWRPRQPSEELLAQLPPLMAEQLREAQKIRIDPEPYVAALRDWVAAGRRSRFALTPDEVVARSRPRATGAVDGRRLLRARPAPAPPRPPGRRGALVPRGASAAPDNWTYKRQAWTLADPLQGPTEQYESDWLSEVRALGAEHYYPAVALE